MSGSRPFYFILFAFIWVLNSGSLILAQGEDIIGTTSAEEVRTEHRIFDIYTKRYQPDSTAVLYLSEIKNPIDISIIFGTWCHDTKKHLPSFFKIIEEASNPNLTVSYIGISRDKKQPEGTYERFNLTNTPTFIIYYEEKEIGRIVEQPDLRLEEELVEIIRSGLQTDR